MNAQARSVIDHFRSASGLGGFAIHNYGNSYLSGLVSWPMMNPSFPTNVVALTAIQRLSEGTMRLTGAGVPNHSHTVEAATDPNAASFSMLTKVTADEGGALHYDDNSLINLKTRFYRVTFP
jgi:microcystin-dependent protein